MTTRTAPTYTTSAGKLATTDINIREHAAATNPHTDARIREQSTPRFTTKPFRAFHQPSICLNEVAVALFGRRTVAEPFPLDRQEQAQTAVKPIDLTGPRHRDTDQDDAHNALGVALRLGQDECRRPRSAIQ